MTIPAVTERQLEVLRFLRDYTAQKGYSPTVRELQVAFEFKSPNGAHEHLRRLARSGLVRWQQGAARTIVVTESGCSLATSESGAVES